MKVPLIEYGLFKEAKPLLLQAFATDALSLIIYGFGEDWWLFAVGAPFFGFALPYLYWTEPHNLMLGKLAVPMSGLLVLAAVTTAAALGVISRWIGHIALGAFSIGSGLCLLVYLRTL